MAISTKSELDHMVPRNVPATWEVLRLVLLAVR
jgi:hypothetical protein